MEMKREVREKVGRKKRREEEKEEVGTVVEEQCANLATVEASDISAKRRCRSAVGFPG